MSANELEICSFLSKHHIDISPQELISTSLDKLKAGQITIHPYGFYIIKPIEFGDTQVRLHVWVDGVRHRQKPDWPPHNHNTDLISLVILGELEHNVWRVTCSHKSSSVLYEVSYDGSQSILTKTGVGQCAEISETAIYRSGQSYFLSKYDYHSVEVDFNKYALTLCIVNNTGDQPQHVVGDFSGDSKYAFSRRNVTANEKMKVVEIVERFSERMISETV